MDYNKESLKLHKTLKGKWTTESKYKIKTKDDLALMYTPGVAAPCKEISKDISKVTEYTMKSNTVAIVTDGTAVLGLGDIGPEASLPVMEGKAVLLKEFGDVDAVSLPLNTKDPQKIIEIVKTISPAFGGILLEDIAAPKCVTIEESLQDIGIPVFHDDQHGTAIVVGAALINASRLTGRKLSNLKVVLSGTGAAGSSIARHIKELGVKEITAVNKDGVVNSTKKHDFVTEKLLTDKIIIDETTIGNSLVDAIKGKDVFIGVSAPGIVSAHMIKTMSKDPWVFAMANPTPEIMPDEAKKAGAYIVGTGRSDFPNQINNLSAFPGLFRGLLDAKAKRVTSKIKVEVSKAIAYHLGDKELNIDRIIPSALDKDVAKLVAQKVVELVKGENNEK